MLKNKPLTFIICISIIFSFLYITPLVYCDSHKESDGTMSVKMIKYYYYIMNEIRKERNAKILADYIYSRILYYQELKGVDNVERY